MNESTSTTNQLLSTKTVEGEFMRPATQSFELSGFLPGEKLKIVELFDKHSVSCVAVTQSFNTSNSMGRLMLHVLLSFAQYERELTGERIRDKIAASKKLGYWLVGYTPFGYDCLDKHLKINEAEAKIVRYIFDKFLELRSITETLQDLKQAGIGTRSGNSYSPYSAQISS
jgi:DNA invertase Pin-like site-specific DNA recombinase